MPRAIAAMSQRAYASHSGFQSTMGEISAFGIVAAFCLAGLTTHSRHPRESADPVNTGVLCAAVGINFSPGVYWVPALARFARSAGMTRTRLTPPAFARLP